MPNTSNLLQHSPAVVLSYVLTDMSLGSDPSARLPWPVFATNEPDLPDNCVTVFDSVGKYDGRIMVSGKTVDKPGFQVRVRSKNYELGYARACVIRTGLCENLYNKVVHIDSASYLVQSVNQVGQVLSIGKELSTTRRSLFVVNGFMVVGIITS